MSRKTFELTPETIKVLNGSATKVADEYGCDASYLHQILGKTSTDPFAKFEWLYAAAVRAGCDVGPWITRLEVIKAKYRGKSACLQTAVTVFTKEASEFTVSHLKGDTPDKKLAELNDIMAPMEDAKQALLNEINTRNEDLSVRYNGNPVSTETRGKVQNILEGKIV